MPAQFREHHTTELRDQTWRARAACAVWPATPWDFDSGPQRDELADQAVAICLKCPVIDECLADAIADGDTWTIRGGQLPDDRT